VRNVGFKNLRKDASPLVDRRKEIRALLNQGMNDNLAPIQKLVWV
jgi:hypothetical protein